jgi:hypothetical protein
VSEVAEWHGHFGRVFTSLDEVLPYDPENVLLGIYLTKYKTSVHINNCLETFVAVLFMIAKTLKQLRCPLSYE